MLRKLLLVLALALPFPALAQAQGISQIFAYQYDLDATAYIYCATGDWTQGMSSITTSGSSTTVTAVSGAPFAFLTAGDDLQILVSGATIRRKVTTATSSTSIVISGAAITLPATTGTGVWKYRHRVCGTAVTNGWLSTSGRYNKNLVLIFTTLTGTGGVDVKPQCRYDGDAGVGIVDLFPAGPLNYTAVGGVSIPIPERCSAMRVGLQWRTANVGTDSVSAFVYGEQ